MTIIEAIDQALQDVDTEQVFHPALGFQERVFCYELYHCLRNLEGPDKLNIRPARIQGELNKSAQNYFAEIVERMHLDPGDEIDWSVSEAIPDLLIHDPNSNEANLAVIEAKRRRASADRKVQWDLAKLALFSEPPLAYVNRILLIINEWQLEPEKVFDWIRTLATHNGHRIELCVWTPKSGTRWFQTYFSSEAADSLFRAEAERRRQKSRKAR